MYKCAIFYHPFEEFNEHFNKTRSARTFVFLNNDIFIEILKNKKYLHISLNYSKPFIEITDYVPKFVRADTSLFAQNIKKYFANARISNFKQLNNDRIVSFDLFKTFENYETLSAKVYCELFSNHPNIIITDLNDNIIFAKHYTNIQSVRLILNNIKYEFPTKKFDFDPLKHNILSYINEYNQKLDAAIIKDQNLDIFKLIKNKTKNLIKKIESLKQQKDNYENYNVYKEAGNYIFSNLEEDFTEINIDGTVIKLDPSLDNIANANKLFKKYKKAKKGLELIDTFINETAAELEYFSNFDVQLSNYTIDDLQEIRYLLNKDGYLKNKANDKFEKPSFLPYYIEINGTKIAFGKNNIQNDNLTFNLAKPQYYFLHITDYHGAHVVIFDDNPDAEIIKIAAELTLFLSHKEVGDIQLADIKDVKKTSTKGKVILNKYETITIKAYNMKIIKDLVFNAKRF